MEAQFANIFLSV